MRNVLSLLAVALVAACATSSGPMTSPEMTSTAMASGVELENFDMSVILGLLRFLELGNWPKANCPSVT